MDLSIWNNNARTHTRWVYEWLAAELRVQRWASRHRDKTVRTCQAGRRLQSWLRWSEITFSAGAMEAEEREEEEGAMSWLKLLQKSQDRAMCHRDGRRRQPDGSLQACIMICRGALNYNYIFFVSLFYQGFQHSCTDTVRWMVWGLSAKNTHRKAKNKQNNASIDAFPPLCILFMEMKQGLDRKKWLV